MARATRFQDIDLKFRQHPQTNELTVLKNDRAINRSLQNLMLMDPSSSYFEPEKVPKIRNLLFEPMTIATTKTLEKRIEMTVGQHEPRVRLLAVVVRPNKAANRYDIRISYRIIETGEPAEFTTVLERTG